MILVALSTLVALCSASPQAAGMQPDAVQAGSHTSNWAVLLSTSRYWFNYRHISDALTFYHICRRLGISDSNIILMLPDDMACSPRNPYPGQVFNNKDHANNLYGEAVEVDYRGYEVTVENFLRVLTGRHAPGVPRSKRLLSDAGSNVLVYLAGHGGDDFMKFQDQEEVMGKDIADAIAQMHEKARYRQLLLFVETCEAETLTEKVYSPNVLTIATSKLGEKSYSHHTDMDVGLTVTDRVTYHGLQWFNDINVASNATLQEFLDFVGSKDLDSTLVCSATLFPRQPSQVRVTDFFGSVPRITASAAAAGGAMAGADSWRAAQPAEVAAATASVNVRGNETALAAGAAEHADSHAEMDVSSSDEQPSAPSAAPGLQPQQCSEQSAEGVMPGWASHQDAPADVPLLLALVAVVAAVAAASHWSPGRAAAR